MKLIELHERLRLEIRRRIDLGTLSSSLLARQTGLAQAHVSNFLHGRRRLSLPAFDRILLAQTLSIEDLTGANLSNAPPPAARRSSMDSVPIVAQSVAMTSPAIPSRAVMDTLHFPDGLLAGLPVRRAVSRRTWDRFVAVRITSAQAPPVEPLLTAGSIAILDRHYNSLAPLRPPHPNLYALRSGGQFLLRHVTFDASCLILRPQSLHYPVEMVELGSDETPSDYLIGRVCLCITRL